MRLRPPFSVVLQPQWFDIFSRWGPERYSISKIILCMVDKLQQEGRHFFGHDTWYIKHCKDFKNRRLQDRRQCDHLPVLGFEPVY